VSFISDISGEIVSYPVHMKNATQYNSGETAREQETIGSSKFLMFIPYNEETIKIDHGKRFLIDKYGQNPKIRRKALWAWLFCGIAPNEFHRLHCEEKTKKEIRTFLSLSENHAFCSYSYDPCL